MEVLLKVLSFRSRKDEILKAFRLFDDDETGKISFKNLKRVAKEILTRFVKALYPIRAPLTREMPHSATLVSCGVGMRGYTCRR